MEVLNKALILREIPLFSDLSPLEFFLLEAKSSLAEYKKGEIIYAQGSAPSAFYCLISGRVVIYAKDSRGSDAVLEYLHRGKYFGIISLLTGDTHSVTAKAINDCLILTIKDEDFTLLLKRIPSIAIDLGRTLSRRLKRKELHEKIIFESTVISVVSFYPRSGKSTYALNLALSLKKETHKSVIVAELSYGEKPHSLPQKVDIDGHYRPYELSGLPSAQASVKDFIVPQRFGIDLLFLKVFSLEESYLKGLVNLLSLLNNEYHYIVLDLPSQKETPVLGILNQSDLVHMLIGTRLLDLGRSRRVIRKLEKEYRFPAEKIRVVINEWEPSVLSSEEELVFLKHDIFATLPPLEEAGSPRQVLDKPQSEYGKSVRRIARREGDCQLGLVLGVGAAYGYCHIGVLKVLEEKAIPIDIICGSSMGAVIATLWALGRSTEEIITITKEFKEPRYIWELADFTLPLLGFIKGNKLYNFLKKHLSNKTFHDLKVPIKVIASDVKRKEFRSFDKGLLVDAIMASCTMPGVFKPFKFKDEMLFDGGIICPLPTEPLLEIGVKKIIAVNVTPSREDVMRQCQNIKEDLGTKDAEKKRHHAFSIKYYLRELAKTNILDIIFSSFEIMQSEVAQKEAQLADVVLHPDTMGMHWLEFGKAEEFAKRGEEETRKKLEKIMQIVNE